MSKSTADAPEGEGVEEASGRPKWGGVAGYARWYAEFSLLYLKSPVAGKAKGALWHFLRYYREARPEILTELKESLLPTFDPSAWKGATPASFVEWTSMFRLPQTYHMRHEAWSTLDLAALTLQSGPPIWSFEWVLRQARLFFSSMKVESEPHPSVRIEPPPEPLPPESMLWEVPVQLRVSLPPAEAASPKEWDRWRRKAGKELVQQVEMLSYTQTARAALDAFERDEPKRLRDLKWLALKQAGFSAAEIADREGPERGISEEGVWKAIRRAADAIGLRRDLIRQAEPGRKPST